MQYYVLILQKIKCNINQRILKTTKKLSILAIEFFVVCGVFWVAFPCLLVEVVGEVVSDYYSGVVEFESLGGVYAAYLLYSVGVVCP